MRTPIRIRPFLGTERGTVTVETVVIFPLLVWAYTAMFVFWDAYKTENINLKSAYTIADMISREQRMIDDTYIEGARTIYRFLNAGDTNQQVRVSVVSLQVDSDGDEFHHLEWSHGTEGLPCYSDVSLLQPRIPIMAPGDQVIVVDTASDWAPVFNVGLPARQMRETVVTSPRFVPRVLCTGAACTC
jgi:hypothetical protein